MSKAELDARIHWILQRAGDVICRLELDGPGRGTALNERHDVIGRSLAELALAFNQEYGFNPTLPSEDCVNRAEAIIFELQTA